MLEYINFCLICALFALTFYLYAWVKRYLPLLKMAEELIGNLGNQTQSIKKFSNAFSPEIASYIWVRFTQKNSSPNLMKKK